VFSLVIRTVKPVKKRSSQKPYVTVWGISCEFVSTPIRHIILLEARPTKKNSSQQKRVRVNSQGRGTDISVY
jgi:hypothetical protein